MAGAIAQQRRDALGEALAEARGCTRCPELARTRAAVVAGTGSADADVLFVAEAPGRAEEQHGAPLAGQAGALFDRLLAGIGMRRADVFVTHLLMCRPPGNRDPQPAELERCHDWLLRQIALVRPRLLCPLGGFATKLLRGEPTPITRTHGHEQPFELAGVAMLLYPLFDPAAALYASASVELLRADVARIPALLATAPAADFAEPAATGSPTDGSAGAGIAPGQLGLF